ncbi:hypothetical protein Bbelb_070640 [Branchiostoma belcheri]|nr:hypothetical protein Bbelb_070640 [Branchiostoma belcheri]
MACPSGYESHQHSRSCYNAFNQESDYSGAKATCSSDGGTLAMPRDGVTNSYLFNLKNAVDNNAFFRFGLTDIRQEGRRVWEDGVALGGFSSWNPGEPNSLIFYNEDCAEYYPRSYGDTNRNMWNDHPCSSTRNGYVSHQPSRSCYKAFDQWGNYNNARAACSSDGGTLAMPRDAVTNIFLIDLKNTVDENAAFFFGLTLIRQERRWVWEDGAALGAFRPWGINEPDDYLGNQDCGEYISANWKENVSSMMALVLYVVLASVFLRPSLCYLTEEEILQRLETNMTSPSVYNTRLKQHLIARYQVDHRLQCSQLCYLTRDCQSYNYYEDEGVCELNDLTYIQGLVSFSFITGQDPGWDYYDRHSFYMIRFVDQSQPWISHTLAMSRETEDLKSIDVKDCQVGRGASFRGVVPVTRTGRICQRWDSQTPHGHGKTPSGYPESGLVRNYCRNPDGENGVWCYTMDPDRRWELCDVPQC